MNSLLEIKDPKFIKDLSIKELEELAFKIREYIIETVSKTGGHLASNLGTVELVIALHYIFNLPYDRLVFDIGHQAYTHKILTGRAKDFKNLRQKDGVSGFLSYDESNYDVFEAGHSSTSLSAVAGFLKAKELGKDIGEVIALIGDASLQNGLAFEALNYLGGLKNQKAIIILNDNKMSISENVGRLSKSFRKLRVKKSYISFKKIIPQGLRRMFRALAYGDNVFSAFGFKYYGPIDGHNFKQLFKYLELAKKSKESIVIHVRTQKGKGYKPAEQDQIGKWHSVAPFNIESGKSVNDKGLSWSKAIANLVTEEAIKNDKIHIIAPAMIYSGGFSEFQEKYPNRITDVGIAELHASVMASSMAKEGLIPVIPIYSTFLQRAYDGINHDLARPNLHAILLVDHAGIISSDGSTHQGIFDLSLLNSLPNMTIMMPKDLSEAKALLKIAINDLKGPVAFRFPKGSVKDKIEEEELEFGKYRIELPLQKKNVISYGENVNLLKEKILKQKKKIGLINALFIKPLDYELLRNLKDTDLYVYEEAIEVGGLNSSLHLFNSNENLGIKIHTTGIDKFLDVGTKKELLDDALMTREEFIKKI
ncbi:MAG TPA: 1-deoxy-D-xylulose-5-phosphate synthase [Acholeplasma sp.]|nr:1-deoxy-D-xylulose-5-phosphate synthase [Acholeplasma sp.]